MGNIPYSHIPHIKIFHINTHFSKGSNVELVTFGRCTHTEQKWKVQMQWPLPFIYGMIWMVSEKCLKLLFILRHHKFTACNY